MKFLTFFVVFFNALIGYAQLNIEDKEIDLGSYDCLWISSDDSTLNSQRNLDIVGKFLLSDHYLFYPERFESPDNYLLTDHSLIKESDSTYSFRLVLSYVKDDPFSNILFYLCGYALAGSDSICYVEFSEVRINDVPNNNFAGRIIIKTENSSIPYVRMPQLKVVVSPVEASEIILEVILWQSSDVRFEIYDVSGKIMKLEKFEGIGAGNKSFNLNIEHLSSGVYNILMITNHGQSSERFLLIK